MFQLRLQPTILALRRSFSGYVPGVDGQVAQSGSPVGPFLLGVHPPSAITANGITRRATQLSSRSHTRKAQGRQSRVILQHASGFQGHIYAYTRIVLPRERHTLGLELVRLH